MIVKLNKFLLNPKGFLNIFTNYQKTLAYLFTICYIYANELHKRRKYNEKERI